MKKVILFILLSAISFVVKCQPESIWQLLTDGTIIRWAYSGGDEFNEDYLDINKWNIEVGSRYCNKELQYFTNGNNMQFGYNSNINSGTLKLIAKPEYVYERAVSWLPDNEILMCGSENYGVNKRSFNYTSAEIHYKQKFKYGLFEIRFKLPAGRGLWPAFWLYGGNPNEEFDIFEYKGETPNKIHIDMHCPSSDCNSFGGWLTASGNFSDSFNTMMGEWGPNACFWYLNGTEFAIWLGNLNYQGELIANLSIANDNGPFSPGPNSTTPFPAIYEIDYIRIWTRLNCEQIITISNYSQTLTDPTVQTGKDINISNLDLNSNQFLSFIATNQVLISPNTHIKGNLHAKIVNCPGPSKNSEEELNSSKGELEIISKLGNNEKISDPTVYSDINNPPVLYTKIYPNPTLGQINIEFEGNVDGNIKIELINSSGQKVFEMNNINQDKINIDISHLSAGIYYLSGTFGKNTVSNKIILE